MPGRVPQSSANEKRAARACGRGVRQGSGRALPLSEGGASGARLARRLHATHACIILQRGHAAGLAPHRRAGGGLMAARAASGQQPYWVCPCGGWTYAHVSTKACARCRAAPPLGLRAWLAKVSGSGAAAAAAAAGRDPASPMHSPATGTDDEPISAMSLPSICAAAFRPFSLTATRFPCPV